MRMLIFTALLCAVCVAGVPLHWADVGSVSLAIRLKNYLYTLGPSHGDMSFTPVGTVGKGQVVPLALSGMPQDLTLRTRLVHYRRRSGCEALAQARVQGIFENVCPTSEWEDVRIRAPDVSDRKSLLTLAKMAQHAYVNSTWEGKFNQTLSFEGVGGVRGHVFASASNETVVISIRGSTPPFLPGGGSATERDKVNDNLLFSCCCARVSWSPSTVCGCFRPTAGPTGIRGCGASCVQGALVDGSYYYRTATEVYTNVTQLYPNSQLWVVGHSFGGVLASLMGMTYGLPSVTFEAPGDRLAARRLHLPVPGDVPAGDVEDLPIYHVYHTADPLAQGQCVGQMSPCGQFGYALESRCHTGKTIIYDTVAKLGWAPSLLSHRMEMLTDDLLASDWDTRTQGPPWTRLLRGLIGHARTPVPPAEYETGCQDCAAWEFRDTL